MSYRTLAIVVATLGALLAVKAWNAHLIAEGDTQGALRVQTQWDTAETKRRADIKEAEARAAIEQAEAERKTRMAKLRPIVTHFGHEKLSGLTDETAEESLRYLDQIKAGAKEIVFETSEAETEVEDDDDLM